jgi:dienelactone hydrolase
MKTALLLALAALACAPQAASAATNAEKAKATATAVAAGGGTASTATTGAKVTPAKADPKTAEETPTPLTAALKDGTETRITCVYKGAGKFAAMSGTYHYKLWVPAGYSADPKKTWKTIFIADPSGKAKLGAMSDWIKEHGYIAVMLEESKNGPWEPTIGNFLSAHEDVVKRMRVAEGQKVATGFSGGARASSLFVTLAPGFGGLVFQGAGCSDLNPDGSYVVKDIKVKAIAGTFGKKDMNYSNAAKLKKAFGARIEIFEFEGGHQWAPKEIVEQALDEVDGKLPK